MVLPGSRRRGLRDHPYELK